MQEVSVSALVRYLKNKLDTDNNLQKLTVTGEISNFHQHFSGHLYFTLKDEQAQINCVMFKSSASGLKFKPKNGDKVKVSANTSIFESSGQLQLYVSKIIIDGLGDLYAQYEQLKNHLFEQGFFNDEHKKKLDIQYVNKVAVLVGDKSAAMSDIKTTFLRRWPIAKVDFYPVLVQGEGAPNSIIERLLNVDTMNYDVIILARGGGSFEDLFCFNDENLVKTIYGIKTFIVTGVGHEQDYTLVDFVSDLRAPTPTASVELITPNIRDVYLQIDNYICSLNDAVEGKFNAIEMLYDFYVSKLSSFVKTFDNLKISIDNKCELMQHHINKRIDTIYACIQHIDEISYLEIKHRIENNKLHLKRFVTLLEAYNYQNVLAKGYTYIKQNDRIIKCKKDLNDEQFEINFIDGKIFAERK